MEDELFSQLKDDIQFRGINDPILYYETPGGLKLVIEGHTRLRAAIDLGLVEDKLPSKEVKEEFESLNDIKLWMLRHQIQRRNLSAPQKLRLSMAHKSTIEARAKENLSKAGKKVRVNQKIDTAQELANMAGVSRETAKRYMKVYEKGSQELLDEMDAGLISIFKASYKAKSVHKEKTKIQVPKIMDTYEQGLQMLDNGETLAMIVVKNEETIRKFMPTLYGKYVFLVKDQPLIN
jgi:ParB family chromosome partitioning protein